METCDCDRRSMKFGRGAVMVTAATQNHKMMGERSGRDGRNRVFLREFSRIDALCLVRLLFSVVRVGVT